MIRGVLFMPTAINPGDTAFVFISCALVLFMTPGLAFFYGGLVKRKNVLNTMMASFSIIGVASVMWVLFGYSLSFGGDIGHFIGNLQWFGLNGVGDLANTDYAPKIPHMLFAAFQMMFAIITPALITGAIAERMKFSAQIIFIAVWSLIVYYPLAHMMWGIGGLLKNLGALDFAGGNVVHISSGIAGLVACIFIGRRKNHGIARHVPHNIPFVLLGASILWFGWFGFNGGSALSANGIAIHAFMTTNTAGACGMLSWMLIERIFNGKATALGAATGAVCGLASITQGSGYVPIWAAIIVGTVVSPICWFAMSTIKNKFGYDDALDVFGAHGVGGILGGIATGLFASKLVNSDVKIQGLFIEGKTGLFTAELISIVVTISLSAIGTLLILFALKAFMKNLRVTPREESEGLDGTQHGESAYPSFSGLD